MPKWTQLELTRRQVAICGSVQNALTGQLIQGADVQIEQAPETFTRWLAMKAVQYRDRWQTMLDHPDKQYVALGSTFYLIRKLGDKESLKFLTCTAIDGCFYFVDLPDGMYSLTISLPSAGSRYSTTQVDNIQVSRDNSGTIQRATVGIDLPPTAIQGTITEQINNSSNPKSQTGSQLAPIVLAKIQVEGSDIVTYSDREGNYILSGLEVWQQSSAQSPKPVVRVSAQGYKTTAQGVALTQGQVKSLDFQLLRL
ncbi:hypothetical protein H6F90_02875 [Trichocoleus sp. FACHB-591]|uniref:hypothetical protein n=1 Tax=Trichocoleus sp. FACHB-591 TaxID=2692872 RepID=UPI00168A3443|nr:hypothetical protein [Trichocoleus sp. FACHB-591]MBD2094097.1 hypothetical protein [Trichocoleus sp. FACHB-591]